MFEAIAIPQTLARRDGGVLFGASALAALVLVDLRLGRLEAAVLVLALAGYLLVLARAGAAPVAGDDVGVDGSFRARDPVLLIAGLTLVLVSGTVLVDAAVDLARSIGVSEWVIGATVVAAGTSTPEFAVSLLALRRGQVEVSVGNLLGSNVLGVLGVAGLVRPLAVDPAALSDLGWLLVVTGFVTVALWSGRRLSRAEGGALVGSELTRWAFDFLR